jgi:proteasome lid subunit RPN8/RPN11
VNFQVTVLKILASHPDGWASMADLKRDMAILASGFSDLSIFAQGMVVRIDGGWRITEEGRRALILMERLAARAATAVPVQEWTAILRSHPLGSADPSSLAVRNQRRQIRRRRRRAAAMKKEPPKSGG